MGGEGQDGQGPTAEAQSWTGRSGRSYRLDPRTPARDGRDAIVRAVLAEGPAQGRSVVPEGTRLALKALSGSDPAAALAFRAELRLLVGLSKSEGATPCPTVFDGVQTEHGPGAVMDWCEVDLEQWWSHNHALPEGFGTLCAILAEVARAVGRARRFIARDPLFSGMHPELRPRAVLRCSDGTWVPGSYGLLIQERSDETSFDAATQLMVDTANFSAPEQVFRSRVASPGAVDSWSIGAMLLALVRMRGLLVKGGELPATGSESYHLRSRRASLVHDLYMRKPGLFVGRPLDPRQFMYPDRLPDPDREALVQGLAGLFDDAEAERGLAEQTAFLLDRALAISPERRFQDPDELAKGLDQLARAADTALRRHRAATGDAGEHTDPAVAAGKPAVVPDPEATLLMTAEQLAQASTPPPPPDERTDHGVRETWTPPEEGEPEPATDERTPVEPTPVEVAPPPPRHHPDDVARIAALEAELDRAQARKEELKGLIRTLERELDDQAPGAAGGLVAGGLVAVLMALAAGLLLGVGGTLAVVWTGEPQEEVVDLRDLPPPPTPEPKPAEDGAAPDAEEPPGEGPEEEGGATAEQAEAPAEQAAAPKRTARSSARKAKPAPEQPEEEPEETGATGSVRVEGATAWLVGEAGRVAVGDAVPVGAYELFFETDGGGSESLGRITVGEGSRLTWRCGFGKCRPVN